MHALECYDRALQGLADSAETSEPSLRATVRMNRANALLRLGRAAEAVTDFDLALEDFGPPNAAQSPEQPGRIGAAWLNRAGALRAARPDELGPVAASLDQAIAALRLVPAGTHPVYVRNLAAALLHRGDCLLRQRPSDPAGAATHAREAVALVAPIEGQDPASADVGLKARLVLLGALGPAGNPGESTDLAESGVALARQWVSRGVVGFAAPAHRLIEIAGTIYQLHQPQFLTEFWREHLVPPAPPPAWVPIQTLRESALRTLRPAWHTLQEKRLQQALGSDDQARAQEILQEIEALVRELEAA